MMKEKMGYFKETIGNSEKYLERMYMMTRLEQRYRYAERYIKPELEKECDYINCLKGLLVVKTVEDVDYIHIGEKSDGGYVIGNSFDGIDSVYSIGVGGVYSFEEYFANLGIDVYMYDHTIDAIDAVSNKMHFIKKGICGEETHTDEMLTIDEMIRSNGHSGKRLIMQMDVEGYEWEVIPSMKSNIANCFDQIIVEFHGLLNLANKNKILKSLQTLNETHQLVHIHANNADFALNIDGWTIPNLLEATYMNRTEYTFLRSDRFFPTDIDSQNITYYPDITLGYWN